MNKRTPATLLLACLGIVLIVTAACVPPPAPAPATATPSNAITDIVWQWTSVTNQTTRVTTTVPDPQDYTITFRADGTLNGKADCNTFSGTYSQQNGFSIKLGPTTMAACGDASLDQQYLQLLGAVAAGGPDGAGNLALENGRRRAAYVVRKRRGRAQRREHVDGLMSAATDAPAFQTIPAPLPAGAAHVDIYWRDMAELAPLVIVAHGFTRRRRNMSGWAGIWPKRASWSQCRTSRHGQTTPATRASSPNCEPISVSASPGTAASTRRESG